MGKVNERNYVLTPTAEVKGEAKTIPIELIRPNDWNYNTQTEQTFAKLLNSIRRFGFVEPLIVRRVPKQEGYELINGEHRFNAARELRLAELPIIDLGELDDAQAKQLAIILNELGGSPDEVRLADLLREINVDVTAADMTAVLPYGQRELDMMLQSVDFSFANLSTQDSRSPADAAQEQPPEEGAPTNPADEHTLNRRRIVLSLEKEAGDKLAQRLAVLHSDPVIAVERALEAYFQAHPEQDPAFARAAAQGQTAPPGNGERAAPRRRSKETP